MPESEPGASCPNGLTTTVNCADGCVSGQCADCREDECANGNQSRRDCNDGQLGPQVNCGAGEVCQGAGQCTFRCTPNQTRCNGQTPQRCNGAGTAFDRILGCNGTAAAICQNGTVVTDTCAADETCQGGQCLFTCLPNEARCIGTTPQRCDGAGAACDSLAACSGNVATICQNGSVVTDTCLGGEVCQGGRCVFRCTPNSFISCTDRTLTTCNAAGTEPVASTCNLGASCGAGSAGCVGRIVVSPGPVDGLLCVPNSVTCDGITGISTCAPDGLSRGIRPCAEGTACRSLFGSVTCVTRLITLP